MIELQIRLSTLKTIIRNQIIQAIRVIKNPIYALGSTYYVNSITVNDTIKEECLVFIANRGYQTETIKTPSEGRIVNKTILSSRFTIKIKVRIDICSIQDLRTANGDEAGTIPFFFYAEYSISIENKNSVQVINFYLINIEDITKIPGVDTNSIISEILKKQTMPKIPLDLSVFKGLTGENLLINHVGLSIDKSNTVFSIRIETGLPISRNDLLWAEFWGGDFPVMLSENKNWGIFISSSIIIPPITSMLAKSISQQKNVELMKYPKAELTNAPGLNVSFSIDAHVEKIGCSIGVDLYMNSVFSLLEKDFIVNTSYEKDANDADSLWCGFKVGFETGLVTGVIGSVGGPIGFVVGFAIGLVSGIIGIPIAIDVYNPNIAPPSNSPCAQTSPTTFTCVYKNISNINAGNLGELSIDLLSKKDYLQPIQEFYSSPTPGLLFEGTIKTKPLKQSVLETKIDGFNYNIYGICKNPETQNNAKIHLKNNGDIPLLFSTVGFLDDIENIYKIKSFNSFNQLSPYNETTWTVNGPVSEEPLPYPASYLLLSTGGARLFTIKPPLPITQQDRDSFSTMIETFSWKACTAPIQKLIELGEWHTFWPVSDPIGENGWNRVWEVEISGLNNERTIDILTENNEYIISNVSQNTPMIFHSIIGETSQNFTFRTNRTRSPRKSLSIINENHSMKIMRSHYRPGFKLNLPSTLQNMEINSANDDNYLFIYYGNKKLILSINDIYNPSTCLIPEQYYLRAKLSLASHSDCYINNSIILTNREVVIQSNNDQHRFEVDEPLWAACYGPWVGVVNSKELIVFNIASPEIRLSLPVEDPFGLSPISVGRRRGFLVSHRSGGGTVFFIQQETLIKSARYLSTPWSTGFLRWDSMAVTLSEDHTTIQLHERVWIGEMPIPLFTK